MNKKLLKEILAAHADQLVNGTATQKDYLKLIPDRDEELAPLMDVAERVQSTLRPITPSLGFEEELKRQLLTTAHLRQVEGYEAPHPFRDFFLVLGIVFTFILSLAAVFVAMRHRPQTRQV